jgi:MFS family permease
VPRAYWLGAAVGAAMTLILLDKNILAADSGWRVCFGVGAVLGLGILLVRRHVPESPRWLFIHGHDREADRLVDVIEHTIADKTGRDLPRSGSAGPPRSSRSPVATGELGRVALGYYLGAAVMVLGGLAEVFLGVDAGQKSLEDIAEPLSAERT